MKVLLDIIGRSRRYVAIVNTNAVALLRDSLTKPRQLAVLKPVSHLTKQMAQKAITSFFLPKTPKRESTKSIEKETSSDNKLKDEQSSNLDSKLEEIKTPEKHSSENDNKMEQQINKNNSPASDTEKPRKKRRKIDSSDSETEITSRKKIVKTEVKSPTKSKSRKIESSDSETEVVSRKEIEKTEVKSPTKLNSNKKPRVSKSKKTKSEKSPLKESNIEKSIKVSSQNTITSPKTTAKEEKEENGPVEKVSELEYNPSKSKYHPIDDACWSHEEPVPYLALARTLEAIEGISSRLRIVEILTNYLRSVIVLTPEDLLPSLYLCLNRLAPPHHGLELGVAETYLMKAIGQCTGRTLAQMKLAAKKTGDLGLVAEQARTTQRTMFSPPPLHVRNVLAALREVARMTGQASVTKKIGKIQSLYVACRQCEARYLIRSLAGKLRIGLAEQSVLQALAQASATTPPGQSWPATQLDASKKITPDAFKALVDEFALTIKSTFSECPDYELVVPALLRHGVRALPDHCKLTPGVPLKPMLAHPTRAVSEVLQRFENVEFTCEWKYDGERAQIHIAPELGAKIFSRNQEDNTTKYPDVLERLPILVTPAVTSAVLDTEAVAYDLAAGQILPFQILSTRKRKDASSQDIKVQVCVFVFDLLYLNGRALVREPLAERRRLLREHFREHPGQWQFAKGRDCKALEEVAECLEEAVRGSCEGLMVKSLSGPDATYEIARRSHNWLKLKKDYLEGAGDSIDAVVIGGYHGRGKRVGAFGGFLLAAYDPDTEQFQSLCKIGTGFSDDDLQTLSGALKPHAVDSPPSYYSYDNAHAPDVWFESSCVWEIKCADLSLSPAHRAAIGLVDPDKGISLRFPRFVRARDDKQPEQATSARQLADMYLAQDQVRNSTATARRDHHDFY